MKFVAVLPSIWVNSLCNLGESLCLELGANGGSSAGQILGYDSNCVSGGSLSSDRDFVATIQEVFPNGTQRGAGMPVRPNWMIEPIVKRRLPHERRSCGALSC